VWVRYLKITKMDLEGNFRIYIQHKGTESANLVGDGGRDVRQGNLKVGKCEKRRKVKDESEKEIGRGKKIGRLTRRDVGIFR
jgi:hypothetical protein